MRLSGKVVVITGASMGIGEALAHEFVLDGAFVVLTSRDQERCDAARQRIGTPERTAAFACDVRSRDAIRQLASQVRQAYGKIDIWINNAGFGILDSVEHMPIAAARDLFATNLIAPIEAMQIVTPILRAQHEGLIVNISSVAGHIAVPYMAAYCASKHALNAIGKAARLELKGSGVSVLTVCPGFIRTDFSKNAVKGKERMRLDERLRHGITAQRLARAVVRACAARKREIVVPWTNWLAIYLYRLCPPLVEWFMAKTIKPMT